MPPDQNATPADADDQPPAGTTSQADTPDTDAPSGSDQPTETISLEAARKLRSEAASLRRQLKVHDDEKKAREDADKSEAQKLADDKAALATEREAFANERKAHRTAQAVEAAARKLGFRNPAKALRLLEEDDLGIEDDGTPSKAEEALKALAAAEPYLVGSGSSGSPTNPDKGRTSTLTKDQLRSMTREEIAALPKAEVDAALRGS